MFLNQGVHWLANTLKIAGYFMFENDKNSERLEDIFYHYTVLKVTFTNTNKLVCANLGKLLAANTNSLRTF